MIKLPIHSSTSSGSSGGPVAASHDTWRIEMKCGFPGPTATRCFFLVLVLWPLMSLAISLFELRTIYANLNI